MLSLFLGLALCAFGSEMHLSRTPSYLKSADRAYKERAKEEKAQEALKLYRTAKPAVDSLWRLSMACHYVGLHYTKESDEKIKLFREGKEAGLSAIKLDADCAPCHFWTAINMTLLGQQVGALRMLFALSDIRKHIQKIISLDPSYAYGGAYRLLGQIDQKLPGIAGGSNKAARQNFEKAIQLAPDEPLNYLLLARLLSEDMDEDEEALAIAKKGLALPKPSFERAESLKALEQMKQLVGKLEPSPGLKK